MAGWWGKKAPPSGEMSIWGRQMAIATEGEFHETYPKPALFFCHLVRKAAPSEHLRELGDGQLLAMRAVAAIAASNSTLDISSRPSM